MFLLRNKKTVNLIPLLSRPMSGCEGILQNYIFCTQIRKIFIWIPLFCGGMITFLFYLFLFIHLFIYLFFFFFLLLLLFLSPRSVISTYFHLDLLFSFDAQCVKNALMPYVISEGPDKCTHSSVQSDLDILCLSTYTTVSTDSVRGQWRP